MIKPSEHKERIVQELEKVGIKPDVSTTQGNHLRISWTVNGQSQNVLTSSTPSDYRATLNARARVRQLLRSAGAYDREIEAPSAFVKALSVPEKTDTLLERVGQLEDDVSALLDMLVDLSRDRQPEFVVTEHDARFIAGWNAHAKAVEEALGKLTQPRPTNVTSMKPRRARDPGWVLRHLRYDVFRRASEISEESGRNMNQVYNKLCWFKKMGLVESDGAGGHRKTVKAEQYNR